MKVRDTKTGRVTRLWGAGAMALALAACEPVPYSPTPAPNAPQNQPTAGIGAPSPAPAAPSAKSRMLSAYYAEVQNNLLRNELMRTDNGGPDTPFSARRLAENFETIALRDEFTKVSGQYVAKSAPNSLHRWAGPVRVGLEFGASVPAAQREKDRATLSKLIGQLRTATGHDIALSSTAVGSNFSVLVLNDDELAGVGNIITARLPGVSNAALRYVQNLPRTDYCVVMATDPRDDGNVTGAVAIIRGENPDLLRASCFHEEIAQGLGLPNDSPMARPSIFNDDGEFAFLTRHDALLLRILYDPRLTPGMPAAVARPIVDRIAHELLGESL